MFGVSPVGSITCLICRCVCEYYLEMESLTIQRNYRRNNGICSIMVGLCCILIFTQQLSAQIEEWPEYTSDETDCANSWDKFLTNSYVSTRPIRSFSSILTIKEEQSRNTHIIVCMATLRHNISLFL